MKMTLGKATSVLLALLMILTTIPIFQFTVSAAEATEESIGAASGTTGKCTWTLENGVLTIIGNGAMGNYSSSNYAPWKGNKVKSVIIENGVTNIGNYAFDHCEHLTSITISDSVTSIGEVAFSCCSNLTSVTIPDYVTGIGRFAFIDCSRLTSVNIPNSVTSIGNSVFKGCRSLTSVDIPDSVTSIGSDVFSCSGLSNITVNNNNTNYCSIDGNLYDKNATVLIQYATGKTDSSFITPDTVTSIGDGAFRGCSSLTNVTILNSVTSIGDYVFESCENLISVTISESVTSIGRNAFYGCSSLINVTIPNSVTSIDEYAFFCCTSLTSVDIPDSVISIGYWAFKGCSSLTSVYIPESVTMIGSEAFSCRNISNISVDNNNPNYLSIDGNLYYKYKNYYYKNIYYKNAISLIQYAIGKTPKSFLIPDYVISIGYRAFDNCSALTDVTIPNSVISIGRYAFFHCDNLKSITIPNSVESIGEGAFQHCKSLTDITIPNSVTSISNSAFLFTAEDFTITGYEGSAAETFANNYGYTFVMINEPSNYTYQMLSDGTVEITGYTGNNDKISIPSEFNGLTVTSISNSAFVNCKKLTAVTIPNSVINISDSAFKDCSFLTSVDIPNSVTVIGDYVFSGCISLSNIQVDKNNTAYCSIDGNLYNKAATILIQYAIGKTSASFTIPDSVTSISSRAFSECNNLTSVTIPYFVANICDRAFLNCHNLSNITIPNSVINIDECAFLNCNNLTSLTIPKSVSSIGEYAFGYNNYESGFVPDKVDDFTITGYRESVAEIYANENGFNFLMVDDSCDFEYKVCDNGTAEITKYKGNGGIVTIPSIIDGYAVTSLGYLSFSYCTNLSSVYIPDSVINIGARAFYSCNNLATVHISKSVTNIDFEAFYQCSKLLSVTIPDSVTKIRQAAFSCCSSLSDITVDSNNEFYCSIDGNLYNKNGSTLIQYTISKSASSFTIPNSVTHIEKGAFANCSNLTSINIPNSVRYIYDCAFSGCCNLTHIIIPDSVTNIGSRTFENCSSLNSVTVPDSVTNIGTHAFCRCTSLSSVTLSDSITSLGEYIFCDCQSLTAVTIPNSVISIGVNAFRNCYNLKVVIIPDSVKYIYEAAFKGCTYLATIEISDNSNLKDIDAHAFENTAWYDSQLDGVVYAGSFACGYKGIMPENTSLRLKNETVGIASRAFKNYKNLKYITIPDSVKYIGKEAFFGCENLDFVNMPDSVIDIGYHAFNETAWYKNQSDGIVYFSYVACDYKGAMALDTSLGLKEETVSIAEGAFKDCTELKKIMVPKSVKIIGAGAFSGCTNLISITVYKGVTSIGSKAFENCNSLTNITIPDSVTSIGYYAFNNCALTTVTIPPSVISIGEKAFGYNDDTKVDNFKISAVLNSRAYTYANENGFSAIEYKTEMPNFKWGTDNWSFCNDNTDPNSIKDETVLQNVLNQVMSDFNITNVKQIIDPFSSHCNSFRGSCFGMTVSEILFKQNLLELSDYIDTNKENCKSVYQCGNSPEVRSLIGFIHVLQNVGSYGQKIRAAKSIVNDSKNTTSQSDFISELESKLTNGNRCVVIGYSYYSNGEQEQHAVLGYGIDDNNSEKYEEYDKRILIADPNCLSENGVNDNACIYYKSEDKSWVCPYWDNQENITCHWNNTDQETNTSNTDTGKIDFIMRFNSLTDVECFPDNATGDYISGITIFNDIKSKTEVEKVQGTGEVNVENTETDSGITPYSIADGNGAELFALRDSTAKYSITCNQPSNFSMIMDYEKVTYFADVEDEQPISLLVKPDGCINLEGDKIKYSLTMMTDNSNNKSDWYSITVSGSDTNNVTLTKKENVYILETYTPGNVTITAENADEKTTFSFKTSKKALIFKNENTVCVIADTGENGEFETVVNLVFDVNSDCSVDIRDVTDIQKYLAEMPDSANLNLGVADMDNDGKVGIEDATQLQLYLAELI